MLAGFWRTAEAENAESVGQSGEESYQDPEDDNAESATNSEAQWSMSSYRNDPHVDASDYPSDETGNQTNKESISKNSLCSGLLRHTLPPSFIRKVRLYLAIRP
jgi:hypothetical protein